MEFIDINGIEEKWQPIATLQLQVRNSSFVSRANSIL